MSSATDTTMQKIRILTLIMGVALGVATNASADTDQSELNNPEEQPMTEPENAGKRQMETPEVVLQLKYDEGELKRIYLTQFRKPGKTWNPSVTDRLNLCADLCHAGLGGRACGSSCSELIPMGLHSALSNVTDSNATEHSNENRSDVYGAPRVGVCPALCDNLMGKPLCQCPRQADKKYIIDWVEICDAFCLDGYTLGGCPACEAPTPSPTQELMMTRQRTLSTAEGWTAWCDVQCRQGHGGAACNCDRTPF